MRLNQFELASVYAELESDNEETRNNAGEIVLQTEKLAQKLKEMYESLKLDYSEYPTYEDYMQSLQDM
ncbi:MAG: hypothetical protein B0W54_11845 [Cellvibrio sp. 79]|nr:MAG: hypothetical protein B0W54_11845 [Cellvibrio sp. 79]